MLRLEGLKRALERVEENEGCAGVDGVTVERFAEEADERLKELLEAVEADRYRPLPLLKILVEKRAGSGKTRRLLVPAVRDRVLQTAVARELSASFEEEFLESSFAYRPGRSVDRAVARVIQLRDRGFNYVLDADISAYFDSVSHSLLLELVGAAEMEAVYERLIRDWVHASFWDGARVRRLTRGIAQGSPLSPVLANYFLADFDAELERSDHHLVRYADDFLVLCRSEDGAREAQAMVEGWLARRELSLNLAKTAITGFHIGFQFLGVHFRGEEVFIPWKYQRAATRLVFMAKRMPERMVAVYLNGGERPAMARALRKAGVSAVGGEREQLGGARRIELAHLYVTEQGAIVRKSGDRFLVEKEDRIVLDVPYHKLETVLLFGNVQVTTQAMGELLEKGIPVSIFTAGGRFRGSLTPPHGKDIHLRLAQFKLYGDGEASLRMAKQTLAAKVGNGAAVLESYGRRAGDLAGTDEAREVLARMRKGIEKAENPEAVLGMEGTAAREYFPALMRYNRSGFAWMGRAKHPAPDPINALLSLTYTIVLHEIVGLAEGLGLDPYLGFLHQPDYGRPSLALDLLEPLRHPVADRFVIREINLKVFAKEDFEIGANGGCLLTPESMKVYLQDLNRWMGSGAASFRGLMRRQVESFVAALRHGKEWEPFVWKDPREEILAEEASMTEGSGGGATEGEGKEEE